MNQLSLAVKAQASLAFARLTADFRFHCPAPKGGRLRNVFSRLPKFRGPVHPDLARGFSALVLSPCLRGTRGLPRRGCRSRYVFSSGRANPALHLVMLSEVETSFSSRARRTRRAVSLRCFLELPPQLRCSPLFVERGAVFQCPCGGCFVTLKSLRSLRTLKTLKSFGRAGPAPTVCFLCFAK